MKRNNIKRNIKKKLHLKKNRILVIRNEKTKKELEVPILKNENYMSRLNSLRLGKPQIIGKKENKKEVVNIEVKPMIDVDIDTDFRSNFKILFLIFNYERYEMLNKIISEINEYNQEGHIIDYIIFDDESSYFIDDYRFIVNPKHRGKELLWKTFDDMFKYVKSNKKYDLYVISPNDFINFDFNRLIKYGYHFINDSFLFNLINDGREKTWGLKRQTIYNDEIFRFYFNDCSFITNWKTLKLFNFEMLEINRNRFLNKNVSSGVGYQISKRCLKLNINIYKPIKSLAYHGEHKSLMHGEFRKKNKLISI